MAKEYIEREALRLAYERSLKANTHNYVTAKAIHSQEHRHMLHVLDKIPAADVAEVDRLIEVCFHEFCMVAIDSPCGCDGCPYGEFGSENNACYEEYKRRMLSEIREDGDNNA